jgi:hypothetical protein
MWYFEEQEGTKTNMKLVIWCFVSDESQSAVVTREERQKQNSLWSSALRHSVVW